MSQAEYVQITLKSFFLFPDLRSPFSNTPFSILHRNTVILHVQNTPKPLKSIWKLRTETKCPVHNTESIIADYKNNQQYRNIRNLVQRWRLWKLWSLFPKCHCPYFFGIIVRPKCPLSIREFHTCSRPENNFKIILVQLINPIFSKTSKNLV